MRPVGRGAIPLARLSRNRLQSRNQAYHPGPVAGVEGGLRLALDVDDDPDLDDRFDGGALRPQHPEPELVEARLDLVPDAAQLARSRDVALDDAERTVPDLPDLRLVPLTVAREDGVDDHGAELERRGIEMGDPRGDVVRLRAGVGVRRPRALLRGIVEPGPAARRLAAGARGVGIGPEGGPVVRVRPDVGDRKGLAVVPAHDVVAAPGRS